MKMCSINSNYINKMSFMWFNWREIAQTDRANGGLGLMQMLLEITWAIKWNRSFMSCLNVMAAWQEEIITGRLCSASNKETDRDKKSRRERTVERVRVSGRQLYYSNLKKIMEQRQKGSQTNLSTITSCACVCVCVCACLYDL